MPGRCRTPSAAGARIGNVSGLVPATSANAAKVPELWRPASLKVIPAVIRVGAAGDTPVDHPVDVAVRVDTQRERVGGEVVIDTVDDVAEVMPVGAVHRLM